MPTREEKELAARIERARKQARPEPPSLPPKPKTEPKPVTREPCPKCEGSGQFIFDNPRRAPGKCYECKGRGYMVPRRQPQKKTKRKRKTRAQRRRYRHVPLFPMFLLLIVAVAVLSGVHVPAVPDWWRDLAGLSR